MKATFGVVAFSPQAIKEKSLSNSKLFVVKDEKNELNPLLLLDAQSRHRMPGEYRWVSLPLSTMATCKTPLGNEYQTMLLFDPLTKAILEEPPNALFSDSAALDIKLDNDLVVVPRDDYFIGSWYNPQESEYVRKVKMYMKRSGDILSAHYLGRNILDLSVKIKVLGARVLSTNTLSHWQVSEYHKDSSTNSIVLRVLHLFGPVPLPTSTASSIPVTDFFAALENKTALDTTTRHLLELPALEGVQRTIFHGTKAAGILSVRQLYGKLWVLLSSRAYGEGGWVNPGGMIDPKDYESSVDAFLMNAIRETAEETYGSITFTPQQAAKECASVSFYSSIGTLYSFLLCPERNTTSSQVIIRNSLLNGEKEEASSFLWVSLDDILAQAQAWNPQSLPNLLLKQVQVLSGDNSDILKMDLRPYVHLATFFHKCTNLQSIAEAVIQGKHSFMNDALMSLSYQHKYKIQIGALLVDLQAEKIGLLPSSGSFHFPKRTNSNFHFVNNVEGNLINNGAASYRIGKWDRGEHKRHPTIIYDYQEEDQVCSCITFLIEVSKCEKVDPTVKWFPLSSISSAKIDSFNRAFFTSAPFKECLKMWTRIFFPQKVLQKESSESSILKSKSSSKDVVSETTKTYDVQKLNDIAKDQTQVESVNEKLTNETPSSQRIESEKPTTNNTNVNDSKKESSSNPNNPQVEGSNSIAFSSNIQMPGKNNEEPKGSLSGRAPDNIAVSDNALHETKDKESLVIKNSENTENGNNEIENNGNGTFYIFVSVLSIALVSMLAGVYILLSKGK